MKKNVKTILISSILVFLVIPFASATVSYVFNLFGDINGTSEESLVQFELGAFSTLGTTIDDGGTSFSITNFPFIAGTEVIVEYEISIKNIGMTDEMVNINLDLLGYDTSFTKIEIHIDGIVVCDNLSNLGTFLLPWMTAYDIKMVVEVEASVPAGTSLGFSLSFDNIV